MTPCTDCYQKLKNRFEKIDNTIHEITTITQEECFEHDKSFIKLLNQ